MYTQTHKDITLCWYTNSSFCIFANSWGKKKICPNLLTGYKYTLPSSGCPQNILFFWFRKSSEQKCHYMRVLWREGRVLCWMEFCLTCVFYSSVGAGDSPPKQARAALGYAGAGTSTDCFYRSAIGKSLIFAHQLFQKENRKALWKQVCDLDMLKIMLDNTMTLEIIPGL